MNGIWVLVAAVLIFAWSWWRLYSYNMRKRPNRAVAHMMGFLLGSFPALFFCYACVASFPPAGAEQPTTKAICALWGIFVASILMVLFLTSRPVAKPDNKPEDSVTNKDDGTQNR